MSIAFSATNPCHLYDLALALHQQNRLRQYHSGYPAWRLRPPSGFPIISHSWRTVVTYGTLRLPAALTPPPHRLFRWQDHGFDRAVSKTLPPGEGDFIHALPGQALLTFRAARERGWRTVLNHASGPVRQQLAVLTSEYQRVGLAPEKHHGFDDTYFAREEEEYALADFHCAASSLVKEQLVSTGISPEKIWVVNYGADPSRFHPPADAGRRDPLKIVFAGQLTLRKGVRVLLNAARQVRQSLPITLDLYGRASADMNSDLVDLKRESWIRLHGPVSQAVLAGAFRSSAVLILPSLEEAFGLVVPQALSCGLPCIVSDRVGARDIIRPRENGSIFPVNDADSLASEMRWWLDHPGTYTAEPRSWQEPARQLMALTESAAR